MFNFSSAVLAGTINSHVVEEEFAGRRYKKFIIMEEKPEYNGKRARCEYPCVLSGKIADDFDGEQGDYIIISAEPRSNTYEKNGKAYFNVTFSVRSYQINYIDQPMQHKKDKPAPIDQKPQYSKPVQKQLPPLPQDEEQDGIPF